ncbi:MAG: L-rhamnose mutarotase [Chloroflexota bacterium]|nr:L-rhamnose mutarotase [Chloroflexota bacterium]
MMKRFGQVVRLRPEIEAEYKQIHVKIWDEIADAIRESGIRNYSIYLKDGWMFAYYEYEGPDAEFDARMEALGNAPRMQEWWTITKAMQLPLDTRAEGEWWANMEEVFHQD